jgi:predicted RecA/RadA family phage recombinase
MKNYIQGGSTLRFTLLADCLAGDVINIGPALSGIAEVDGSTGDEISVKVGGVYEIDKTAPLVIAIGTEVYFNTSTKKVTKTITDKCLGVAWSAGASADETIQVLLDPKRGEQNAADSQAAVVAALGTTSALPSTAAVLSTAGGNTYSDTSTKAAIDGAVTALRSATETRLDNAEAKVDELISALKTAGLMASA